MNAKEQRLSRLRQLIADQFDGKAGQCADALGIKRPQMSRWVTTNDSARQGIAEESARYIEKKLGMPKGWLDGVGDYGDVQRAAKALKASEPSTGAQEAHPIVRKIIATMQGIDDTGLTMLHGQAQLLATQYPRKAKKTA